MMVTNGVYDCPCCNNTVMGDFGTLCDDCKHADCESNRDGAYDDCERPCTCGTPSEANYYVSVIYEDATGETQHADGYVCERDLVSDSDLSWFVPAARTVLESEVTELR